VVLLIHAPSSRELCCCFETKGPTYLRAKNPTLPLFRKAQWRQRFLAAAGLCIALRFLQILRNVASAI
jgi:hypothetical protein